MPSPFLTVAEDIEHLRDDWDKDPKDAVVRRGSAILRRLLVEDALGRAWRHHGFEKQPIIIAPNLSLMLGEFATRLKEVDRALAGGAHSAGVYVAGMTSVNGASAPTLDPSVPPEQVTDYPWRLREFTESLAAVADGQTICRREIVKYFANTAGGVHLEQVSPKVKRREEELVRRVQRVAGRFSVNGRDGLYFELLSIGQAVGKSSDVARLCDRIVRDAKQ